MKIVHVITSLSVGGAEKSLFRICEAFKHDFKTDLEQVVICLTGPGVYAEKLSSLGIETICLNGKRGIPPFLGFFRLVKELRNKQPDKIMSWLPHADLMTTIAMPIAGISYNSLIWNIRGSLEHGQTMSILTRFTLSLLSILSRLPSLIVTNSKRGEQSYRDFGYQPAEWLHIPNGIDTEEWYANLDDRQRIRKELGFSSDEIVFSIVARMDPHKDYQSFLKAAQSVAEQVPKARFLIIGSGTHKLHLENSIRNKVLILGERLDVQKLIRGADISVLSSISEGFPNTVGEAMASELPCIATNVGDCAEIIKDTGIIVSPNSFSELADAMISMAQSTPSARQTAGGAARERVLEHFSNNKMYAAYRKLWGLSLPSTHKKIGFSSEPKR